MAYPYYAINKPERYKDAVFATLGNLEEAQLLGTIDYSSSDEEHCYIVVL